MVATAVGDDIRDARIEMGDCVQGASDFKRACLLEEFTFEEKVVVSSAQSFVHGLAG